MSKSTKRLGSLGLAVALCCFQVPGTAQGYPGPGPNLAANHTSGHSYSAKTLKDLLNDLKNTHGIQFAYQANVANDLTLIVPNASPQDKNVDAFLGNTLANNNLAYKKVNGVYIISKAKATPTATHTARPAAKPAADVVQDVAVNGKVLDDSGSPLPGVTVVLKGTTRGTSTNANGEFNLSVPASGGTLVFSFIGFTTQEVPIGNQSTFNITMGTDSKALQEVVVVGYGTQRKEDLTGSVTVVSEEDFQQGNITTPEQLIAGKVAGVQIVSNSGAPGAGSKIRIRGGSSLNASNDPLVVIDGVPIDNAAISGTANPLSMINPNDIETFNVLKDASATAIYGSRASNGVIIITTKKGRAGEKMKVSFNSQASLAEVTEHVDVLTGDEYRAAVRERVPASSNLLGNANTNWQDLIYQNAFTSDNNLSVSGSVKTLPYRVSIGHLDQEGILKTSRVQRTTGSLNLNPTFLDDHLKVNLNLKGSLSKNRFADEGAIGTAVTFDPTQPVYQEGNEFGGYFEWVEGNGINTLAPRNPLSMLEQRNDRSEVRRSIGNIQLDYKLHFFPDLRANLNLGYDVSRGEGTVTLPPTLASVYLQGGSLSQYEQNKNNNLLDFYLNYAKDYTSIQSRVDLTGGYSYQKFNTEVPPFATLNFAGDTITQAPIPNEFTNVLISVFGRLNYTFKDRYLLTATVRRDGSSRFSPDNRWGTFPALALGWKINEEAFLKDVAAISELKLRLGYGVTGQQDIGPYYPYLPRYAYSNNEAQYQFGNQFYPTLRPAGYDENIKWEETQTWNAGVDFGFLNGKFSGSLEYYFKKTKDLLAEIQIPAGSNLTNRLFTNVGNLENRGIEAMLNYSAISTEKVQWDLSFNGTYNENEITNLSNVEDESSVGFLVGGIGGGVGNYIQINSVGYPRNSFYVYKQVYDQSGRPIERLYADVNNDGEFNDDDFYRYKNIDPKMFLGFSSQLTYDKWSLGFVLRGSVGNYVYNNINAANAFYNNLDWPGYLLTIPTNVLETGFIGEQPERLFSDYFVENASFLRMDNLNLGYNFGRVLNDKLNVRLTATGQNLFVITKYSGLDPEVASGIDNNFYPRPRIYSLGINVDFQ